LKRQMISASVVLTRTILLRNQQVRKKGRQWNGHSILKDIMIMTYNKR